MATVAADDLSLDIAKLGQAITMTISALMLLFLSRERSKGRAGWEVIFVSGMELVVYSCNLLVDHQQLREAGLIVTVYISGKPEEIMWMRYASWMVTCPVLLINLSNISGKKHYNYNLVTRLLTLDQLMVITGITAAVHGGVASGIFYAIGTVCCIGLYIQAYFIFQAAIAYSPQDADHIKFTMALFYVSWTVFPVLFLLERTVINTAESTFGHALGDLIAKNIFGLLLWYYRNSLLPRRSVHKELGQVPIGANLTPDVIHVGEALRRKTHVRRPSAVEAALRAYINNAKEVAGGSPALLNKGMLYDDTTVTHTEVTNTEDDRTPNPDSADERPPAPRRDEPRPRDLAPTRGYDPTAVEALIRPTRIQQLEGQAMSRSSLDLGAKSTTPARAAVTPSNTSHRPRSRGGSSGKRQRTPPKPRITVLVCCNESVGKYAAMVRTVKACRAEIEVVESTDAALQLLIMDNEELAKENIGGPLFAQRGIDAVLIAASNLSGLGTTALSDANANDVPVIAFGNSISDDVWDLLSDAGVSDYYEVNSEEISREEVKSLLEHWCPDVADEDHIAVPISSVPVVIPTLV